MNKPAANFISDIPPADPTYSPPGADFIGDLIKALAARAAAGKRLEAVRPFAGPPGSADQIAAAKADVAAAELRLNDIFFGQRLGDATKAFREAYADGLAKAKEALAAAGEHHNTIMRDSAPDEEIEATELAVSRAKRAVARKELAWQNLAAKEKADRQACLAAAWARFYPGYTDLQRQFVAVLRTAVDLQDKLRRMTGFADSQYDHVTAFLKWPPDYTLPDETVEHYARELEESIAAAEARSNLRNVHDLSAA